VQLNVLERDLYANYDIVRLTQAITNLLSNAIKFSPAGAAVRVDLSKSGDEAKLEVRDQGPGVPESFRDRIFQKFAQANSTSSRTKEGTGLGLAITRELMQAMGGEVDFESEEGSGACFWITLPLAEPGTQ
jgi:signal transduction histidine kinase